MIRGASGGGAGTAARPNVLWVMADQLRYHALGRAGEAVARTPHLDRLASEGVWCSNAVSHYPVCMPYRAGLVTGLRPARNGVLRHGDFLPPGVPTVAHAFAAAGYRTSWVGKWHLAPESGAALVSPQGWAGQDFWVHPALRGGFQDWFGFNIANNYYETYVCEGEKVVPRRLPGYQTDALTDLSLAYLSGRAGAAPGEPWFHVVSYESPHPGAGGNPRSPGFPVPKSYEALFEPDDIALRPNVPPGAEPWARVLLAGYYRLIANLDDNVGRLLAWLDASGQAERTLVVFLSDHGEMGGSHGLRNKQVPYEESLHLPLVFRLPGVLPRGAEHDGLMSGLDVFPTTAGLCGVEVPAGLDGRDLSRALRGAAGGAAPGGLPAAGHASASPVGSAGAAAPGGDLSPEGVLVQWEDTRYGFGDHPYRAVRTRRHTLVVGRDDAFCLLFDRDADPFELHNLFWEPGASGLRRDLGDLLVALITAAGEGAPAYVTARLATR